jgi:hypothetical protein
METRMLTYERDIEQLNIKINDFKTKIESTKKILNEKIKK